MPERAPESDQLTQPQDLIEFMQASPLARAIAAGEFELEIERTEDGPRDIEFG